MLHALKKSMFLLCVSLGVTSVFSKPVTCPPVAQIIAAKFARATPYDQAINLWELISIPFTHDGKTWDVSFGVALPNVTDPQEALRLGRRKFSEVQVSIESPEVDPIPGFLFCDYTHAGMEYWIQALSPPPG